MGEEIRELERIRNQVVEESFEASERKVRQLMKLKAVGVGSATVFVYELFGWRKFRNGKEVGSIAGLTPTPYDSGESRREQGISKAGNRRVRRMAVLIAWRWIRWQPQSALAQWYQRRFAPGGVRARKIGIVAVARKLLIELWRFLETGTVPQGALLKAE
jgi:transposase